MSWNAGAITGDIRLNTGPLDGALGRARGMLSGFQQRTSSIFGGVGRSIVGNLVGTLSASAIQSAATNVASKISDAMGAIDTAGKTARSLGMTTEALGGLSYAAEMSGMSAEGLSTSVKMMVRNLAEAQGGSGTAKDALAQLGLSAADLTAIAPDQAIGAIADSLQQMENPAQRTAVLMDIFGRQAGPELQAMLADGSAGLDAAATKARELGLAYSDVDAATVEQANDAMNNAGKVITGVLQQAAIAVAPYIAAIADKFTEAATSGGGFGQTAANAVEWVAKSIVHASDYLYLFEAAWHTLKAGVVGVIGGIVQALDWIGQGIVKVLNLIPGVEIKMDQTLGNVANSLFQQAGDEMTKAMDAIDNFDAGKNSQAVAAFFAEARAKAREAGEAIAKSGAKAEAAFAQAIDPATLKPLTDELAKLRKEVEQFSMSDLQRRLQDFMSMDGATPEQTEQFRTQLAQLRALQAGDILGGLRSELSDIGLSDVEKRFEEIRRQGLLNEDELAEARKLLEEIDAQTKVKAALESIQSPLDQFEAQMAEYRQMLDAGRITQQQFDRLESKTQQDAFGGERLAGLYRVGSAEAQALAYDQGRGNRSDNFPRQQVDQQKETNRKLDDLTSLMRGLLGNDQPVMIPGL